MAPMQLIEQHEELIERSPSDMSYAWKGAAIVVYLWGSLSSYASSILFSVLWAHVCGGHCYFWSEIHYYEDLIDVPNATASAGNLEYDWTDDILVPQKSSFYCNWFHFTCMSSGSVAVIFLTMFMICGKGGYDTSLYAAPWRLVLPALVVSLVMMATTIAAVSSFTNAYARFVERLYAVARAITKRVGAPFEYNRPCQAFQKFTQSHNADDHDCCFTVRLIQICSWAMTCSWMGGAFLLLLRIITSADFNLLKVKIYALPEAGPERDAILKQLVGGRERSALASRSLDDHSEAAAARPSERKLKVL